MDGSVDRICRERAFHDARFAGGEYDRSAQMKYDVALKPCFDRYAKRRAELAKGAVVLEYGCAHGGNAIALSGVAKRVEGIDLSKEAVDAGNAEIARRGIADVRPSAQNAEAMDGAPGMRRCKGKGREPSLSAGATRCRRAARHRRSVGQRIQGFGS